MIFVAKIMIHKLFNYKGGVHLIANFAILFSQGVSDGKRV